MNELHQSNFTNCELFSINRLVQKIRRTFNLSCRSRLRRLKTACAALSIQIRSLGNHVMVPMTNSSAECTVKTKPFR